jgi:hypothetical protein
MVSSSMMQASVAEKPTTMYSRNMTVGERPQAAAGAGAGGCSQAGELRTDSTDGADMGSGDGDGWFCAQRNPCGGRCRGQLLLLTPPIPAIPDPALHGSLPVKVTPCGRLFNARAAAAPKGRGC